MAEKEEAPAEKEAKGSGVAIAVETPAKTEPAKDEGPKIEYDAQGRRIWRVGNLTYTKMGLFALCFWLLWIDFTFHLMEHAKGPIVAFRMKNDLMANDILYNTFLATIPNILGFLATPAISVASDRFRGKRGRRIPFLLYASPVVGVILAVFGFADDIAVWMQANIFHSASPVTVAVWTFGVLTLLFTVFNLFLTTVFYYLFNDVVPREHLVKFMALVRAVSIAANTVYMMTIYQYSDKSGPVNFDFLFVHVHYDYVWYPKIILISMAIFYVFAFCLACLKVKEPYYPPPAPLAKGHRPLQKIVSTFQTLFKECFSHPFYIFFFFVMTVEWMTHQANPWQGPLVKELGINLKTLGYIAGITGPVTFILTIMTAGWGDKVKPLPLMVIGMIGMVLTMPIGLMYLIPGLTSDQYLYIHVAYSVSHIPVGIVIGMATWPMFMEMLPKARYGQYSAAMSMCRNLFAGILGGFLCGVFMNALQNHFGGNYHLRFSYVWRGFWQVMAFICIIILWKKWKKMGGATGFKPPVAWDQEYGEEKDAKAPTGGH